MVYTTDNSYNYRKSENPTYYEIWLWELFKYFPIPIVETCTYSTVSHGLHIEVGRLNNLPRQRICHVCNTYALGDEVHFVFFFNVIYLQMYALNIVNIECFSI